MRVIILISLWTDYITPPPPPPPPPLFLLFLRPGRAHCRTTGRMTLPLAVQSLHTPIPIPPPTNTPHAHTTQTHLSLVNCFLFHLFHTHRPRKHRTRTFKTSKITTLLTEKESEGKQNRERTLHKWIACFMNCKCEFTFVG